MFRTSLVFIVFAEPSSIWTKIQPPHRVFHKYSDHPLIIFSGRDFSFIMVSMVSQPCFRGPLMKKKFTKLTAIICKATIYPLLNCLVMVYGITKNEQGAFGTISCCYQSSQYFSSVNVATITAQRHFKEK